MSVKAPSALAGALSSSAFPLLAPDGSASAPSYSFATQGSTGWFLRTSGALGSSVAGTSYVEFLGGAVRLSSSTYLGWSSGAVTTAADVRIERQAAGSLGLHNTTSSSAQLSIFNTRTDASNYESLETFWSSNVAIIRTAAAGSGTSRLLDIRYGNTSTLAIRVGSSAAGAVDLAGQSSSAAISYRVGIGVAATISATSGTHTDLSIVGNFVPSGSSTMDVRCVVLGPTINYASGGAGRVQLIRLAPTNTALPTGLNAAIVSSSTAEALGGVLAFNVSDETTNYEYVRKAWTSNIYQHSMVAAGSGTWRNIGFAINDPAAASLVVFNSTSTITGGVTDGYTSSLRLTPTYNAATAQTVTRHNYLDLNDVTVGGAGPAAVTDATVMRLNAALGTHKATTNTDKTGNAKSGTLKVNINGTLFHIQLYANA